jgi:hypothetical protein
MTPWEYIVNWVRRDQLVLGKELVIVGSIGMILGWSGREKGRYLDVFDSAIHPAEKYFEMGETQGSEPAGKVTSSK